MSDEMNCGIDWYIIRDKRFPRKCDYGVEHPFSQSTRAIVEEAIRRAREARVRDRRRSIYDRCGIFKE